MKTTFITDINKIKFEVNTEVARLAFAGELDEKANEIPYKLIPGRTPHYRCCVYREREIIRERVQLAMGRSAMSGQKNKNIVQVIEAACEGCPINRFNVTKKIPGITCVGEASRGKAIYNLDLVRLVISASDLGLSGYQLADRLYEKYKIGMELADDRYVVAVVTYANEESDMRQLVEALEDISRKMTGKNNVDVVNAETRLIPQIPPMIDTPRQAFFKEKKRIPWREAKGKIAAEALIPYPPGIPLVNPGELVTEEIWEYMEEYRKKGLHFHGPSDASLDSFCVL